MQSVLYGRQWLGQEFYRPISAHEGILTNPVHTCRHSGPGVLSSYIFCQLTAIAKALLFASKLRKNIKLQYEQRDMKARAGEAACWSRVAQRLKYDVKIAINLSLESFLMELS